jgi:negative regulator of sigma-B (phosphoserine phosphatase)
MVEMKFGIATRPMGGGKYNGDTYFIKEFDKKILISLIDGLGHGESAAIASAKCVKCLEEHYKDEFDKIFQYCDKDLRKTNGVVMGILSIDLEHLILTYAGVGNINSRVLSSKSISLISRDGIVGYRLPNIKEYEHTYIPGDTILMYSDGVSSKITQYPTSKLKIQDIQKTANEIMKLYGKNEDDATVIVAR